MTGLADRFHPLRGRERLNTSARKAETRSDPHSSVAICCPVVPQNLRRPRHHGRAPAGLDAASAARCWVRVLMGLSGRASRMRLAFVIPLIMGYTDGTALLQVGYQAGGALTVAGIATLPTTALPIAAGAIV